MQVSRLSSDLKFVNKIGQTLSSDQRIGLEVAVLKLSQEYDLEFFRLWGRVQGIVKNYFIVSAVDLKNTSSFPNRRYFWSSNDFKFAELPPARQQQQERVKTVDQYFTGQHEKILWRVEGGKNFTELDRLSSVVSLVDEDCMVVPLGAAKVIPTKQIMPNPNFKGLKIEKARSLQNYVHLREPKHAKNTLLLQSDKALNRDDFLDSLAQDTVKSSWSLQTDESKTQVTIRSLLWPGYVAYHRTNSSIFGGVYMGSGIRSQDLPFIV